MNVYDTSSSSSSNHDQNSVKKKPTVIVVIGMAGSGKTTLIKALWRHFNTPGIHPANFRNNDSSAVICPKLRTYVINLDPAVLDVPYPVNIDIRDTINYKNVMKQYQLGPNGAIMTSLNLFATRFDKVYDLLLKRESEFDVILVDTPGQIEVFNWSASGTVILDTFSLAFPTLILYVLDTARCKSPITFMSNMIYASGVLYKTKLPFVMAMNKIDVQSPEKCLDWLKNYDSFANDVSSEDTYMSCLSRSCALVMHEFYSEIKTAGVSASTTAGMEELEVIIRELREEFLSEYWNWIHKQRSILLERKKKLYQEQFEESIENKQDKPYLNRISEKKKVDNVNQVIKNG